MRRDVANEIVVAIAVVAVLAFAVAFGILLSVSDGDDDQTGDNTPDVVAQISPTPSIVAVPPAVDVTPEATATAQEPIISTIPVVTPTFGMTETLPAAETLEIKPTETETSDPLDNERLTPTVTEGGSSTLGNQATATPRSTDIPTETPTDEPAATLTNTATTGPTNTAVPTQTNAPTATPTDEPTATERPTATASPTLTATNTATEAPTRTAVPTLTPLPTATSTATERPTATAQATSTSVNTATFTPTATTQASVTPQPMMTSDLLPTASSQAVTPLPENTATTQADCPVPVRWRPYVIQPGNTLEVLAQASRTTVQDLQLGNCLAAEAQLLPGDLLYLPRSVPPLSPDGTPLPSGHEALTVIGCSSPSVRIASPIPGQRVPQGFAVIGTATHPDFGYYELQLRAEDERGFILVARSTQPIFNNTLGTLNTDMARSGRAVLRLIVVDVNGIVTDTTVCVVPIHLD
ncbi:MAG: hypothetical protein SF029_24805 [bacterium]|nr:hypothetical protein [bacterium]